MYLLGLSLAAALLGGLFQHPLGSTPPPSRHRQSDYVAPGLRGFCNGLILDNRGRQHKVIASRCGEMCAVSGGHSFPKPLAGMNGGIREASAYSTMAVPTPITKSVTSTMIAVYTITRVSS